MIDRDQFYKDGYIFLRIEDLIPAEEMPKFNEMADRAFKLTLDDETFQYVYSVLGKNQDPDWPFHQSLVGLEEKIKLSEELGLIITQKWYESTSKKSLEMRLYFRELVESFIRELYPEFKEDTSNIRHQDAITLYLNGDFTNNHRDGQNQGRLCAVLVYLTPEEQYQDSNGGSLAIAGNHEDRINYSEAKLLKPVRGNIAILDFTENNVFHEVRKVVGDFRRFCFITFMWNKDKLPEELKRATR